MGGCAVGCLLVLAQPLILLWEWLASVKIGYDRIFGGRQAVPKETIMSWSTAKVGKAECVRPALAEEFGKITGYLQEPEKTIAAKIAGALDEALASECAGTVVSVKASGSQSTLQAAIPAVTGVSEGVPAKVTNRFDVSLELLYGFVE